MNFGAAGTIIVEDADNQLPKEFDPRVMDDYIVAIYYVITDDITKLTNDYIKNCICLDKEVTCFNKKSCDELRFPKSNSGTLSSWDGNIRRDNSNCANNQFDSQCVLANCENLNLEHALSCVAQGMPFFANPDGYEHEGAKLLLTNGQHEPTLEISADTWVRLRLGYMSTDYILRVARHSNLLGGHHNYTCTRTANWLAPRARLSPLSSTTRACQRTQASWLRNATPGKGRRLLALCATQAEVRPRDAGVGQSRGLAHQVPPWQLHLDLNGIAE